MRTLLLNLLFIGYLGVSIASGQGSTETPAWAKESQEHKDQRLAWWRHDRFGMFIHWGLYAVPARHEWVQQIEQRSTEEYKDKYFNIFDPDLYNPKEWAAYAKEAGMKYIVLTARHHEGFSLWDTKVSDYKAPNTPAKRDLLKP